VIAPIVTGLSTERRRPLGFSLFFSAGIATGILGGFLGGHLPGWIRTATTIAGAAPPKQAALLAACALCALAVWPASRLSLPGAAPQESTTYPWNPFVARFLVALSAWSFAVGAFNPLFSAYFARFLRASEAQIGNAFSASQVAQVGAVLLAPAVLGRLGIVRGVAAMQVAAALALACLSAGPPVVAAGAVYAAWMSFQSMCEPGTYSLLMSGVQPGQRHGASALNFFVIFASQAAAAYLAGAAVTRFGYPVLLASAAAVAGLAALVFRFLLRNFEPENK
jgi:predicted MFS family arabinose efflux permease